MRKMTQEEIYKEIEFEDKCGVNNLLQEIFSHPCAETGLDVLIDRDGYYKVVKGDTLRISNETKNNN